MNMHNVLSLETIAPKVTGAEQAWGAELINNPPPKPVPLQEGSGKLKVLPGSL